MWFPTFNTYRLCVSGSNACPYCAGIQVGRELVPVFKANDMILDLITLESNDDIATIVREEAIALFAAVVFKQADGSTGMPASGAPDPLNINYELRMPADLPQGTQEGGGGSDGTSPH